MQVRRALVRWEVALMDTSPARGAHPRHGALSAPHFARALSLLLEALATAEEVGRDPWQFAVEMAELRAVGLSGTNLRSLLCHGYVAHSQEQAAPEAGPRRFRRLDNL